MQATQATQELEILDTQGVAHALGCSYTKAYELMRSDQLPTINMARKGAKNQCLRVTRTNLNEFINKGGCSW